MSLPSTEKPDRGAKPSPFWHPTATFLLGLVGGLGVGVLCFHMNLDNLGAEPKAIADSAAPPAGPPEKGRTLFVAGFDAAPPDLSAPVVPPPPRPTPLRVRLEGKPVYPPFARQAGLEGPVDVTLAVDDAGRPISCSAETGHPLLKQAALDAARTWRFYPATRLGRPVPGIYRIHFEFRLHPSTKDGTSV